MRIWLVGSVFEAHRCRRIASAALLMVAFVLLASSSAAARPGAVLEEVSHDPFTNPGYEHRSEVEPDVAAHGRTVVATYQVGRAAEGGAVAIGVAVSRDDGRSWSDRILQGSAAATGGRYERATDPSVSFGAGGDAWLVGFLGVTPTGPFQIPTRSAVLVARSTSGGSFAPPVVVARAPRGIFYDKPWVACDDHSSSPYFGRCYALWDELGLRHGPYGVVLASTSLDGGRHWSAPIRTTDLARGTGLVPLIRQDGSVAVVYLNTQHPSHPAMATFASLDGGRSWGGSSTISGVRRSGRELPVRDPGLPSTAVASDGTITVAWSDCRFEPSCAVDDIVVAASPDGETWSRPAIAVRGDPATGTSLATPGVAVRSRGRGTWKAIVYYAVSGKTCSRFSEAACSVTVAYAASRRSGWGEPIALGWRMRPSWFPCTRAGCMWGDYIAAAFLHDGRIATMLPLAKRPSRLLDVRMYAPKGGLPIQEVGHATSA